MILKIKVPLVAFILNYLFRTLIVTLLSYTG